MKRDTRDIAKGALTNFSGILLGTINFLFYIFLSRAYGSEVVGIFVFSRSSIDIISKLGIIGLDMGVLSLSAKYKAKRDEDAVYRTIGQALFLGISATLSVIVLLEAIVIPWLGSIYIKENLILPLRIMAVGMIFWTLSAIFLFATRALRIMKYEVIVKNGVEPISIFALAVPFYFMDMGTTGLSVAFVFSVAAGTGVSLYFFSREFSIKRTFNELFSLKGRGRLFSFALPIGIYDSLDLLLKRVDLLILTKFAPTSSVGIYSMVQNVSFVFKKIRQSFDPIIVPVISASHELKDKKNLLEQYRNATRWVMILDIAFLGLTFFSARSIMGIFGKDFIFGYEALILLTAAIMVNSILGISELFILIHRPFINLLNTIGALIAAVGLNLLLIPKYGMAGAAVSVLITFCLINTARLIEVYIVYKLQPFTRYHVRILAAGASSFIAVFLFSSKFLNTRSVATDIVSVIIFFILYYIHLMLLGMAEEEKKASAKFFNLFKFRNEVC